MSSTPTPPASGSSTSPALSKTQQALLNRWQEVSLGYAANPGVLVDTVYQIASRKGARLKFNIASDVNVVTLQSPSYFAVHPQNANIKIRYESTIRLGGENTGAYYYHASPWTLQDIALSGYQKNMFDATTVVGGTYLGSPWGFYSVAHPWFLKSQNSFYDDPYAYIYSQETDAKLEFMAMDQPVMFSLEDFVKAASDKGDEAAKKQESEKIANEAETKPEDRIKKRKVNRIMTYPEPHYSKYPSEYSGNMFIERILTRKFSYRTGPTYTFAPEADEIIHGPTETIFYPKTEIPTTTLNSTQVANAKLIREKIANQKRVTDETAEFDPRNSIVEKKFMDSYQFVSGSEYEITTMDTVYTVLGSHFIQTGGATIDMRGDFRVNRSFLLSPMNLHIRAGAGTENWNFSDRKDFHRGMIMENIGVIARVAVDDEFYVALAGTDIIGISISLHAENHIWFLTALPMFIMAPGMKVVDSRYTVAHFIFESLGMLLEMLMMPVKLVGSLVNTAMIIGGNAVTAIKRNAGASVMTPAVVEAPLQGPTPPALP